MQPKQAGLDETTGRVAGMNRGHRND